MRLPSVSANFAISVDGKIATRGMGPTSFTSVLDRRRMLELRAEADAIMIGRGTLEADDMPLRLPSRGLRVRRVRAGKAAEPLRVIFTDSGRLRKNLRIFRGGPPIVVFTTRAIPETVRRWLDKVADVRVEQRAKHVDPRRALAVLAKDYGVRRVMCEGGAELFRSLVDAGLVQDLHVTIAPLVIGGSDAPTLIGPAPAALLRRAITLRPGKFQQAGNEVLATYRFPAKTERQ
ncbi:MAG: 2,5-diamino-6-ribosylamino-4(3H)-pyrimidinone 5-phosphate reductase [Verrucomicrobiota bacterium]|jgi:riboflavin-specific deaminase-like protein